MQRRDALHPLPLSLGRGDAEAVLDRGGGEEGVGESDTCSGGWGGCGGGGGGCGPRLTLYGSADGQRVEPGDSSIHSRKGGCA